MLSIRDVHQDKRFTQTESEGMGKIFHANINGKKIGIAIHIYEK